MGGHFTETFLSNERHDMPVEMEARTAVTCGKHAGIFERDVSLKDLSG